MLPETADDVRRYASSLLPVKKLGPYMDRALSEVTNGRSLQEVDFDQIGSCLTAVCKSSASASAYVLQVSWTAEDDSLTSSCTCPSFPKDKVCKHIIGLLLQHAGSKVAVGNNIPGSNQRSETTGDNPPQDTSTLPSQPCRASLPRAANPPCPTNLPCTAASSSLMASGSKSSLTDGGSFKKRRIPAWISQLASTQSEKAVKAPKKTVVSGNKQAGHPVSRSRAAAVGRIVGVAAPPTQDVCLLEPLSNSIGNDQQAPAYAETQKYNSAINPPNRNKDQLAALLSSQPKDHDSHASRCMSAAEPSAMAVSRLSYLAKAVDDSSLLQACRLVQKVGTNASAAAAAAADLIQHRGGSSEVAHTLNSTDSASGRRLRPDTSQREAGFQESSAPRCKLNSKPGPVVHDLTEDVDVSQTEIEAGCLQAPHRQTMQALQCALPSQPVGACGAATAAAAGVATTRTTTTTTKHPPLNMLVKKPATARRSLAEIMEDSDDD